MSRLLLSLLAFVAISIIGSLNTTYAFFEAGQKTEWPATIDGLTAKINLSNWKFASEFYQLSDFVNPEITIYNPSTSNQTVSKDLYLYISKVTESPKGINIENGLPGIDGLSQDDLNNNEQSKNDTQSLPTVIKVGEVNLAPGEQKTISYSYPASEVGYYQLDFSTLQPGNGYQHGYILAAGFIRVLPKAIIAPSIMPSASPVASPLPTTTPTASPSSSPTPTVTKEDKTNNTTTTPSNNQGLVLSAVDNAKKQGSVLGISTLPNTGSNSSSILILSTILASLSVYLLIHTKKLSL